MISHYTGQIFPIPTVFLSNTREKLRILNSRSSAQEHMHITFPMPVSKSVEEGGSGEDLQPHMDFWFPRTTAKPPAQSQSFVCPVLLAQLHLPQRGR